MPVKESLLFHATVEPTVLSIASEPGMGFDLLHKHVLDTERAKEAEEHTRRLKLSDEEWTSKDFFSGSQIEPWDHQIEAGIESALSNALASNSKVNLQVNLSAKPPKIVLSSPGVSFDNKESAEEWDAAEGKLLKAEQDGAVNRIHIWLGSLATRKEEAEGRVEAAKNGLEVATQILKEQFVIQPN